VPGTAHAGEQLIHEPGGAALGVGLVEHLARVGADREDRVIPELG
jgi:hypothetical protein